MIGDLLRAFVVAVVARELTFQLPRGVRVDDVRIYDGGSLAYDWSEP